MITLKEFIEAVEYRITYGGDYMWPCFGKNAYCLSAEKDDCWSSSVVFNTKTLEVFLVEACDYKRQRAYRFFNPDHKSKYFSYASKHRAGSMNEAWDTVNYVDLEQLEDWLDKASSIVADRDYDTRVSIALDLTDKEILQLMTIAHNRDITLNQLVQETLEQVKTSYYNNSD